jgi:hypothetical protein
VYNGGSKFLTIFDPAGGKKLSRIKAKFKTGIEDEHLQKFRFEGV